MAIAVARRSDNPVVVNGYGEKEWLPGTHPLVRGYKCILEKGHTVSPKLYKDKTVVFISHRLSTTINADRIYVMENGSIVEQGSHSELMEKNGTYAYMFNLQAEKYK